MVLIEFEFLILVEVSGSLEEDKVRELVRILIWGVCFKNFYVFI